MRWTISKVLQCPRSLIIRISAAEIRAPFWYERWNPQRFTSMSTTSLLLTSVPVDGRFISLLLYRLREVCNQFPRLVLAQVLVITEVRTSNLRTRPRRIGHPTVVVGSTPKLVWRLLQKRYSRCFYIHFEYPFWNRLAFNVRRKKGTQGKQRLWKREVSQEPLFGTLPQVPLHYIILRILLSRRNFILEIDFQSLFLFFSYIITNLRFSCQIFLSSKILFESSLEERLVFVVPRQEPVKTFCGRHSTMRAAKGVLGRHSSFLAGGLLPRAWPTAANLLYYIILEILLSRSFLFKQEVLFSFFPLLLDYIIT